MTFTPHNPASLQTQHCLFTQVAGLQYRMRELERGKQESQELLQEKEACQQRGDRKHREITAQLEASLEDSRATVKELTVKVGLTENRAKGFEEQLNVSKSKCRGLEHQLVGLYAALLSTVDVNRTRLSEKAGSRRRSPSPWRGNLFVKGKVRFSSNVIFDFSENEQTVDFCLFSGRERVSDESVLSLSHDEDDELNMESVQTAIQDFQKELWDAQRERVERKREHQLLKPTYRRYILISLKSFNILL